MKDNNNHTTFEHEATVHLKEIYRAALRMTHKPEDAEELLQETFMQAWKSIERYTPGTNCRAWLFRILYHKRAHQIRKHSVQRKFIQESDEFVIMNAARPKAIPEHLTDPMVIESLDKLPEHYRLVVLLVDVHAFRYREVAEIMGIPVGTVMSRLHRARFILRKTLRGVAREFGINQLQEA